MFPSNKRKNEINEKFTNSITSVEAPYKNNKSNITFENNTFNIIEQELSEDIFKTKHRTYSYPLHDNITNTFPNVNKNEKVEFCIYQVNNSHIVPFLSFLLEKNQNILRLPYFYYNTSNIEDASVERINKIFLEYDENPTYKGFIREKDRVILLFESPKIAADAELKESKDKWWWGTVSEIVDIQSILNYNIENDVSELFLNNAFLLYLYDSENKPYENPQIFYYGNYHKLINFVTIFGLKKASPMASLGPYYYFANYQRAVRYALWSGDNKPLKIEDRLVTINEEGKYDKGGLVRFAIFPGKMKVFMGNSLDEEDNSIVSQEGKETSEIIKQTLRLRDVDAKWANDYNSAFNSRHKIQIKDKEIMFQPQIVVRDYMQQLPLSYHFITDRNVKLDDDLNEVFID